MNLLGIAPGGIHAGICLLNPRGEILDATTFARRTDKHLGVDVNETGPQWVEHVMRGLDRLLDKHGEATVCVADVPTLRRYNSGFVAGGFKRTGHVLDTALIVGAVTGAFENVRVILPERVQAHSYPQVLVRRAPVRFTKTEHPKNSRSWEQTAYDIVLTAARRLP